MKERPGFVVFIASALGAGVTWLIAFSVGFQSWWMAPVALTLGPATAFFIVGPREVIKESRVVSQQVGAWLQRKKKILRNFALGLLAIVVFVLSTFLSLLGILLLAERVFSISPEHMVSKMTITGLAILSASWIVALFYVLVVQNLGTKLKRRKHINSVTRWMNIQTILLNRSTTKWLKKRGKKGELIIRSCIIFFWPISLGLFLLSFPLQLLILAVEFLRVLLTATTNALLRLAINDRLSAAEGALFGGVLSFIRYWGSTQFLFPLLWAMLVGGTIGYGIFRLREALVHRTGESVLAY